MSAPTRINIPGDRLQGPLLRFVRESALQYCTTADRAGATAIVTAARPVEMLSTGERTAWNLLASFVSGDLRTAVEWFDGENANAMAVLMQSAFVGVRA